MIEINGKYHFENYKDFLQRPNDVVIMSAGKFNIVPVSEGVVGDDLVVSPHVYNLLKKRIAKLEKLIKQNNIEITDDK